MNAIERLKCPLCGGNFEQSFECDHDEYDLVDRIEELETTISRIQEAVDCAPLDDAMADIIMHILQESRDA